ncbi:MAG TPA: hypothetical protein VM266_08240 [Solirubrobacteraceae bacterium]|nr:hypothetical protein [Solirubrobacteraceae bacterium]
MRARRHLTSVGIATGLVLVGSATLCAVASVIAFNGWPGLRASAEPERVVLATPNTPRRAHQKVLLGGRAERRGGTRSSSAKPDRETRRKRPRAASRTAPAPARAVARKRSAPRARPAAPRRETSRPAAPVPVSAPAPTATSRPDSPLGTTVDDATRLVDRVTGAQQGDDRGGLAGAADDVVGALDKLVP